MDSQTAIVAVAENAPPVGTPSTSRMNSMACTPKLKGLRGKFTTILADPPWRFHNSTGKIAPEHKRLRRYATMSLDDIKAMPVASHATENSHLYLWTPNALLPDALAVMGAWGFTYKTNLIWLKITKDGKPDRRGVGFYYRNVTEMLLLGVKGRLRTESPARSTANFFATRKEEHSRKPACVHEIIKRCSQGPYLELFARELVDGWKCWGDQAETYADVRQVPQSYRVKSGDESPSLNFQ